MDYIENHGQGLDWYVRELTHRDWHKATQLLPHDVQVTRVDHRQKPIRSLKRGWLRLYGHTQVKRRRWHPGGETTPA
jgi:hypothetical protein